MTFEKLIERLHGTNGVDAILEQRLNDCLRGNYEPYYFVSGFLWALFASGFISDDERELLLDELLRYSDV